MSENSSEVADEQPIAIDSSAQLIEPAAVERESTSEIEQLSTDAIAEPVIEPMAAEVEGVEQPPQEFRPEEWEAELGVEPGTLAGCTNVEEARRVVIAAAQESERESIFESFPQLTDPVTEMDRMRLECWELEQKLAELQIEAVQFEQERITSTMTGIANRVDAAIDALASPYFGQGLNVDSRQYQARKDIKEWYLTMTAGRLAAGLDTHTMNIEQGVQRMVRAHEAEHAPPEVPRWLRDLPVTPPQSEYRGPYDFPTNR